MLTKMPPGFKDSFYQFVLSFALSAYFLTHPKLYRIVECSCCIFVALQAIIQSNLTAVPNVLHYSVLQIIITRQTCNFNYIVKTKHAVTIHIPPALWYSQMTTSGFNSALSNFKHRCRCGHMVCVGLF